MDWMRSYFFNHHLHNQRALNEALNLISKDSRVCQLVLRPEQDLFTSLRWSTISSSFVQASDSDC